jgi:hypothetical protein
MESGSMTTVIDRVKDKLNDPVKDGDEEEDEVVCREGLFLLPYNELAVAQGPKIYQKNEL